MNIELGNNMIFKVYWQGEDKTMGHMESMNGLRLCWTIHDSVQRTLLKKNFRRWKSKDV